MRNGAYLRVLIELIRAVILEIGIGGKIACAAFTGVKAVAYGVIAVGAVEVRDEVVAGMFHFAAGIVVESVGVGAAAGDAGHAGGELGAGGVAYAVEGGAGLGA